jgi:hypothetical protein
MYMTSKLSNPHYTPEIFGKASIINFAVTQDGLRDQLLNVVVGYERPDLEAQRLELVHSRTHTHTNTHKYTRTHTHTHTKYIIHTYTLTSAICPTKSINLNSENRDLNPNL